MEDTLSAQALQMQAETNSADRQSLILVRWMLVMATAALLLTSALARPISLGAVLVVAAFATSNILLKAFWTPIVQRPGAEILLAVMDTLFLSLAIVLSSIAISELFVLSFLVVFLVAFGGSLRQVVASGVTISFLYIWMSAQLRPEPILLDPVFLIRIPFIYTVALYFGSLAARATRERKQNEEILRERRELGAIMEVLETINSSLDLHHVMLSITTKMDKSVGLERCSGLLVENEERRTLVVASCER